MLVGAGFSELKERDTWTIEPGNRVFKTVSWSNVLICVIVNVLLRQTKEANIKTV